MSKKRCKSPYIRIMRAAERGTGVRLTAEEVEELSMDHAILYAATNDEVMDEDSALEEPNESRSDNKRTKSFLLSFGN